MMTKGSRVEALENLVDRYEDELGTYMVKLGGKDLPSQTAIPYPCFTLHRRF